MAKSRYSRALAFSAMMGALGNILFFISQALFKWGQVALDFSHIGTLIAAVYGGPKLGMLVGLLVGIGTGIYFGFIGGALGFLGLLGLPIGKAMTGISVGALARWLRVGLREGSSITVKGSSIITIITVLLGFVPECIFIIFFFKVLVVLFLPAVAGYLLAFLTPILIKAWIEIIVMAFYMGALVGNNGFSNFVKQYIR